jgi:signal transduction histidine kinase
MCPELEIQGIKVMGDAPMLTQALIDVLMHTGELMSVRTGGGGVLAVRARSGGGRVCLSACDPAATAGELGQDSVGGLFSVTRGGAGLGLVMARTIVQAHGGDIVAEAMDGQGARLVVSLPAAVEESA